jgi:hypothetical protein
MPDPTYVLTVSATYGSLGDVCEFITRHANRFVPRTLQVSVTSDIVGAHQGRTVRDERSFWMAEHHVKVTGKLIESLPEPGA